MANDGNNGKVLRFTQDPDFYAKRGDVKRAQNDLLSAIAMYNEALHKDPHDLDTRLAAAEVLTDMSRFDDSNRMLIPYMHEDEDYEKDAWCMVGFNLLAMGELDGAERCFDRFFSMTDEVSERTDAILNALDYIDSNRPEKPLLADAVSAMREERAFEAQTAFDRGEFEKAANIWSKLSDEDPGDKRLLYDSALALLCCRRADKGEKYIGRLLEEEPNNVHALSLGLLYAREAGDSERTETLCEGLANVDTDDTDELIRINGVLLEAERYELAFVYAKRALKLLPYDPLVNHRYALCLISRGQYSKAADVYDKLVRIDRNDTIARFYRSSCYEAENNGEPPFGKGRLPRMLNYQLPFSETILRAKKLLEGAGDSFGSVVDRWNSEPEYRETVRWAFTLHEFNVDIAMINLLRAVGGDEAEHLIRESISDTATSRALVSEAMGALKRMGAEEPYLAMVDGCLIEGKVNMVDLSGVRIPKAYRDIFERIKNVSGGRYPDEVMLTAANIVERFIAGTGGEFPPLTQKRSEAVSAAVEFMACEKCGVPFREDLLEAYGITERRLMNAIDLLINSVDGLNVKDEGPEL